MTRLATGGTLAAFYDGVYKRGENAHFTKLRLRRKGLPEDEAEVLRELDWKGKRVLDFGCGTGLMAAALARDGARSVLGVDLSAAGIEEAKRQWSAVPNLEFRKQDILRHRGTYEAVVSLGTLEHTTDPLKTLRRLKSFLAPGGSMIVTCPNWTNPRGYVLQTLYRLFRAPITLVDRHYLTPMDFQRWADRLGMTLRWRTLDRDWAHGPKLIADLRRRIPNVLRDAGLPRRADRVADLVGWLEAHVVPLDHAAPFSGAIGLYHLRLPGGAHSRSRRKAPTSRRP